MKRYIFVFILIAFALCSFATTWAPAMPYTQKIKGQKVTIKATPFNPYWGSPIFGETKLFYKNKLLYTIDKYYREQLISSNNGIYLAKINISLDTRGFSYNQTAIEILKNGKPFKKIPLIDLIDSIEDIQASRFLYWGYDFNYEKYENATRKYKGCKKTWSKRELRKCETNRISLPYCKECKEIFGYYDSVKIEKNLADNPIFIKNNTLHILTNQGYIITYNFNTHILKRILFEEVVTDKKAYSPPKIKKKYRRIKYPSKASLPKQKNGKTLEIAISEFLDIDTVDYYKNGAIQISIMGLLLNEDGKCERVNVYYQVKNGSNNKQEFVEDKEISKSVANWLYSQEFSTSDIPKGFPKFVFSDFLYFK